MHLRIKEVRKALHLSRDDFGKKLGVSRDVIANIELDRLARPEQKEPLLKLICKTFNVSYEWLTTGQGEMYVQTVDDFVERFAAEADMSFYMKGLLKCYFSLDDEQRQVIDGVLSSLAEMWNNAPGESDSLSVVKAIDMTIERGHSEPESPDGGGDSERAAFMEKAGALFDEEKRRESQTSVVKKSGAG